MSEFFNIILGKENKTYPSNKTDNKKKSKDIDKLIKYKKNKKLKLTSINKILDPNYDNDNDNKTKNKNNKNKKSILKPMKEKKPIEEKNKIEEEYVSNPKDINDVEKSLNPNQLKLYKDHKDTNNKLVYERGSYDKAREITEKSFDGDIEKYGNKIKEHEQDIKNKKNLSNQTIAAKKSAIEKYFNKIQELKKQKEEFLHGNNYDESQIVLRK